MDNFNHKTLKERQAELQKEQAEKRKQEEEKLKKIIEKVSNDEFGLEFLKIVYSFSGGADSPLRGKNDGGADPYLTHVMIGAKSVYERIKPFIPDNKLVAVEREPVK